MYAIKLSHVHKVYQIYDKPTQRIKDALFNTKSYREYHALNDLSVEIPKGEAVGVLGKNGAGKSTLLKIITGVVTPTSGSVEIDGRISAILELNSGFDEELNGYENIFIKGAILGFSKKEIEESIDEIISFADIGEHLYQPVRTYSSGMKSRLGFAIAVNVNPDILIVDEALAVGDDVFRTKCLRKMSEFRQAGKTIFFVSHSIYTIRSFCTHCMWIKDGQLIDYGLTKEVLPKYENFLKEEKGKEAKKAEANNQDKPINKKDYIEITNFKFSASKGFNYGEDITYTFDYEVKQEMPELKWSFTIRDAATKEIYGSDKMSLEYLVENSIGKHQLTVSIKNNLLPGNYLLSGELREKSGIFFVGYSNKRPFKVLKTEHSPTGSGMVFMAHEVINNK